MNDYCDKVQFLLYGKDIIYPMGLDNLLKQAASGKHLYFSPSGKGLTESEQENWNNISRLIRDGYVSGFSENRYAITHEGRLFLSRGGYTIEAKKSKNSLFAFRISIISIIVAIISFLVSIFS